MKFSIIIPMYNEASIVLETFRTLTDWLEHWCMETGHCYEVLFSDDGSSDNCGDLVRNCVENATLPHGTVSVVAADRNYGKGHAVGLGMASASGDFALYTDCDLAYGTDVIGQAADELLRSGADVLIGSRNLTEDGYAGYTFLRKVASKLYIRVLCLAAGFRLTDSQCGFKCFRREIGQAVFAANGTFGWAFDIEILLRAMKMGAVIREMPVKIINHRESKIRIVRDSIRMLRDVFAIRKRLRLEEKNK